MQIGSAGVPAGGIAATGAEAGPMIFAATGAEAGPMIFAATGAEAGPTMIRVAASFSRETLGHKIFAEHCLDSI